MIAKINKDYKKMFNLKASHKLLMTIQKNHNFTVKKPDGPHFKRIIKVTSLT